MPTFEIKVPNDDEGESLGDFCAEAVPRKGERFTIYAHPLVCKDGDHFIGIVDDVQYDADCHAWTPNGAGVWSVEITVWLHEENQAPVIYCTCSAERIAKMEAREAGSLDEGACSDCRKVPRTRKGRRG